MSLTIGDDILTILYTHKATKPKMLVPYEVTQQGLADLMAKHQPQIAKAGTKLEALGLVKKHRAYLRGENYRPSMVKDKMLAYHLTRKGIKTAKALEEARL